MNAGGTCSSLVSLESLKGTWVELGSARALMHIPRAVRDRLMLLASEALRPARATVRAVTEAWCKYPRS